MVRRTFRVWLAVGLAVAVSPLALQAQGRGHGPKGKEEHGERGEEASEHGRVTIFSVRDRGIIQDYFHRHRHSGLPPGLEKRLEPFPLPLERQLGPLPAGYRRGIIGVNVVILGPRSRIADVFAVDER